MEKISDFYPHLNRVARTEWGLVRGVAGANPKNTVYRGIPFAKPPVGALRWRRPRPMEPWEGIRDCLEFGPICPQPRLPVGSLYGEEFYQHSEIQNEDCLYLNIWTPSTDANKKLPVLFWIHGGGLTCGYSHEPEFDGEAFCREGVILVTCNYRLGLLGFYANSELSEEEGTAGNYGHMDQIAAFHWVRRNITAFGGDPDKITVFGQSGGAHSVQTLCASPLTEGEIAGAIIMSMANATRTGEERAKCRNIPMEEAMRTGDEALRLSGLRNTSELRGLSVEKLWSALGATLQLQAGNVPKFRFSTVLDNYVLKKCGQQMAFEGTLRDIPYMVGNTADEGVLMMDARTSAGAYLRGRNADLEMWKQHMEKRFGAELLARFPVQTLAEAEELSRQADFVTVGNRSFCDCLLRAGHRAPYLYLFDHSLPGKRGGSFHSSELWYAFGTLQRCWRPMTGVDYDISRVMVTKNADPNGEGVPDWAPYTEHNRCRMVFSEKSACKPLGRMSLQEYLIEKNLE